MLLAGTATQNHNKIQKLMDRGIPVASKYLQKVWLERDKQAHEKKKASMKAAVDNKTPPRQPHLECRSKKLYEANERLEQINRENHILLRRIDYHNELRHPARIDCHLKQQGPKSLNILMREKRVREIEAENQRIHRQISSVKPTHSVQNLEADYIPLERILSTYLNTLLHLQECTVISMIGPLAIHLYLPSELTDRGIPPETIPIELKTS